mmetsp:Transcript_18445/g.38420  ORF Transcript_18445/g.38420 Transcript_18445/m.38420 type:complete len:114 (+) Transcript_18445:3-344(+)
MPSRNFIIGRSMTHAKWNWRCSRLQRAENAIVIATIDAASVTTSSVMQAGILGVESESIEKEEEERHCQQEGTAVSSKEVFEACFQVVHGGDAGCRSSVSEGWMNVTVVGFGC